MALYGEGQPLNIQSTKVMLKNLVNVAMVLSVCLSIGYANQCKSKEEKLNGCIERSYYLSGQLKYEIPYENGEINGVEKKYYKSGKLKEETPYEYDKKKMLVKIIMNLGSLKKNVHTKMVSSLSIKSITNKGSL